jgi:hypothetical protein
MVVVQAGPVTRGCGPQRGGSVAEYSSPQLPSGLASSSAVGQLNLAVRRRVSISFCPSRAGEQLSILLQTSSSPMPGLGRAPRWQKRRPRRHPTWPAGTTTDADREPRRTGAPVVAPRSATGKTAQAARRVYRWCNPRTTGSSTTSPISGRCTARGSGASLRPDPTPLVATGESGRLRRPARFCCCLAWNRGTNPTRPPATGCGGVALPSWLMPLRQYMHHRRVLRPASDVLRLLRDRFLARGL